MARPKSRSLRFVHATLCEDIRTEIGGKYSLIGVFANEVQVSAFPSVIRLATFVEIEIPKAGDWNLKFRASVEGGEALETAGVFQAKRGGRGVVTLPALNVNFKEPSHYLVEMEVQPDEWITAIKRKVVLAEPQAG